MYYIYEIPGVKVGCTKNFKHRQNRQRDKGKMILLEEYTDIEEASRRERELQLDKGYPVDDKDYITINKLGVYARSCITNESIEKAAESNRGKKRSKAIRNKISKLKKGIKIGDVPSKYRPVYAIDIETNIRTRYDGMVVRCRELNVTMNGLSHVLKGLQKTHRGYTFEYA